MPIGHNWNSPSACPFRKWTRCRQPVLAPGAAKGPMWVGSSRPPRPGTILTQVRTTPAGSQPRHRGSAQCPAQATRVWGPWPPFGPPPLPGSSKAGCACSASTARASCASTTIWAAINQAMGIRAGASRTSDARRPENTQDNAACTHHDQGCTNVGTPLPHRLFGRSGGSTRRPGIH